MASRANQPEEVSARASITTDDPSTKAGLLQPGHGLGMDAAKEYFGYQGVEIVSGSTLTVITRRGGANDRMRSLRPAIASLALVLAAVACSGAAAPAGVARDATPSQARVSDNQIHFAKSGWKTDFSKHSVPLSEISSGGPPRDGIPPLDHPSFVSAAAADSWLRSKEPVISFSNEGEHRAYPLEILIWHEIVNDTVGGMPVTVTYCPLCNSAIAFDRQLNGTVLDFGTTGNLRNSDLIMWDRQTESWWQQFSGEAIVGQLNGAQLTLLPSSIVSWAEFKKSFPSGRVLSRDTGFDRSYGVNPYPGYDEVGSSPFLFNGKLDRRLPPKERVVTLEVGGQAVAYPYPVLVKQRVVNDTVGGQQVVVLYQPGTNSALDGDSIPDSSDIGSTGVFSSILSGRQLDFRWQSGAFTDTQTGSTWTLLGQATAGGLQGQQLQPLVHTDTFWFAWAAFRPHTQIYR